MTARQCSKRSSPLLPTKPRHAAKRRLAGPSSPPAVQLLLGAIHHRQLLLYAKNKTHAIPFSIRIRDPPNGFFVAIQPKAQAQGSTRLSSCIDTTLIHKQRPGLDVEAATALQIAPILLKT